MLSDLYLGVIFLVAFVESILHSPWTIVVIFAIVFFKKIKLLFIRFHQRRDLKASLRVNPANQSDRFRLVENYLEFKQYAAAALLLDGFAEAQKNEDDILYLRAKAEFYLHHLDEALACLKKIKNPNVFHGEAVFLAGLVFLSLGQADTAVRQFEKFLTLSSSSVRGYYYLALAQARLANAVESNRAAEAGLKTFQELDPFKQKEERLWNSLLRRRIYSEGGIHTGKFLASSKQAGIFALCVLGIFGLRLVPIEMFMPSMSINIPMSDLKVDTTATQFSLDEALKYPDKVEILHLYQKASIARIHEITKLHKLQILTWSRRPNEPIPSEIWELTWLKELNLEADGLKSLPEGILKLENLEKLNLVSNDFTSIPPAIYQMKSLKELDLWNNHLTHVDPEITRLENLEVLNVTDNPITSMPRELFRLKYLRSLGLSLSGLSPQNVEDLKRGLPDLWNNLGEKEYVDQKPTPPPAGTVACADPKHHLHAEAPGFKCYTSKGFVFERVAHPKFAEAWKSPLGGVWAIYSGKYDQKKAMEGCAGLGAKLPNKQDASTLMAMGFQDFLPANDESGYWTRSVNRRTGDAVEYKAESVIFNGNPDDALAVLCLDQSS